MRKIPGIIFAGLLLAFLLFSGAAAYYRFQLGSGASPDPETVVFVVAPGENAEAIGQKLAAAGLIRSAAFFQLYVWQKGLQARLQAGEYRLSPATGLEEIARLIASGQAVSRERTLTIPEGWDLADIGSYLAREGQAGEADFLGLARAEIGGWSLSFPKPDFLDTVPAAAGLEGYLFPDTYKVFPDTGAGGIIAKMLGNFGAKLSPDLRAAIAEQGKTVHEAITMASIIEKEVRGQADMALVSGILWKRLAIGMPLEVDSTINYITGKNDPSALYRDLAIDSPYNTYKNYGLPPGPICNPGLAAIKAAVYPEANDYLFYLNRQDTGETIFSRTYEEHLRNKSTYLK